MLDNLGAGSKHQGSRASVGGGVSQLGRGRMNRSESGSSIVSSAVQGHGTQLDQVKIERILTMFNLM